MGEEPAFVRVVLPVGAVIRTSRLSSHCILEAVANCFAAHFDGPSRRSPSQFGVTRFVLRDRRKNRSKRRVAHVFERFARLDRGDGLPHATFHEDGGDQS